MTTLRRGGILAAVLLALAFAAGMQLGSPDDAAPHDRVGVRSELIQPSVVRIEVPTTTYPPLPDLRAPERPRRPRAHRPRRSGPVAPPAAPRGPAQPPEPAAPAPPPAAPSPPVAPTPPKQGDLIVQ